MRKKLAIMLMETEAEGVTIQLFEKADTASGSFDNLVKLPEGQQGRATLVTLDYEGNKVSAKAKSLPVEGKSRDEQPDGIVLGEGPIWLDKEEKDDGRIADTGDSKD